MSKFEVLQRVLVSCATVLMDECMLQAMREAKSGVYCGPLRLLAMEVFDSVNQQVASHRLCTICICMYMFQWYKSVGLAQRMQATILLPCKGRTTH